MQVVVREQHLTKGMDDTKQLYATEDKQTIQLEQVCCMASLWDCGHLRRMVRHVAAPDYVYWRRMDVDADLDLANLEDANDTNIYNRTRIPSEISCAPDLEVPLLLLLLLQPQKHSAEFGAFGLQSLASVVMELRAKKQKTWRVSHAHPRYVKRVVIDGQATFTTGRYKYLLVTGVPRTPGCAPDTPSACSNQYCPALQLRWPC